MGLNKKTCPECESQNVFVHSKSFMQGAVLAGAGVLIVFGLAYTFLLIILGVLLFSSVFTLKPKWECMDCGWTWLAAVEKPYKKVKSSDDSFDFFDSDNNDSSSSWGDGGDSGGGGGD